MAVMKVLMYGWEFPPLISGGLGVACHAIVQELARKNLQVNIVLPQSVVFKGDAASNVNIIGCDLHKEEIQKILSAEYGNFSIKRSGKLSLLNPYIDAGEYQAALSKFSGREHKLLPGRFSSHLACDLDRCMSDVADSLQIPTTVSLTGKYGSNLLDEVLCYAMFAGCLASVVPHDVIHAHDWLTVLAGVEAKRRSKKPLVFHVHALEPDRSGMFVDARIFAIEKYGMQQADRIVAVSDYTKKTIIEKYNIPSEKVTVIHNATYFDVSNLDKNVGNPKQKRYKMVLFIGRLAQQKGPDFFIEIAQKILAKRKDVSFVVAGAGSMMPHLIGRVAALRLGRYIHFTGFLDAESVEKIYRLADVYVMPSISEPFGLSCLEAISYQVPSVISKQSGVAEVLSHPIKVDFWDTDEMVNKILSLLNHHALRKQFMQHASEDLKQLSWDKTADSIIKLYKQLEERHG